jgi:hypothetical protein
MADLCKQKKPAIIAGCRLSKILLLCYFDNFPPLVVTTPGADPVVEL